MLQPLDIDSAMYICAEGLICRECVEPHFDNKDRDWDWNFDWAISGNYGSRSGDLVKENTLDEFPYCFCCFRELQKKELLTPSARLKLHKQELIAKGISLENLKKCSRCEEVKLAFCSYIHNDYHTKKRTGTAIVCEDCSGLADDLRYTDTDRQASNAKEEISEFYKKEAHREYYALLPKLNNMEFDLKEINRVKRILEINNECDNHRRYDEGYSFVQAVQLLEVLIKVLS